jgi:hypothetical protein
MNKSVPIRTSAYGEWFRRLADRQNEPEQTQFWPDEPKHIVSEPKPDTHFPQTNPFSANEPNGESLMKTMFGDERCNLRKKA